MKDRYLKFENIALFFLIVWTPLQIYVLGFDAAGRTPMLLSIIVLIKIFMGKDNRFKLLYSPILFWFIWTLYTLINTLMIGLNPDMEILAFCYTSIAPCLILSLVICRQLYEERTVFNILFIGMLTRLLLIIIFQGIGSNGRLGGGMHSNQIGVNAIAFLFILILKLYRKELHIYIFSLLYILPLYIAFLSASRNAFLGISVLSIALFLLYGQARLFKKIGIISLLSILMLISVRYIKNDTLIGERLSETGEQAAINDLEYKNIILNKLGDRGVFYVQGWQIFKENPINGIGLWNYIRRSKDYVQHSEYMLQVSELGLIGFILFFLYYFSILKSIRKTQTSNFSLRRQKNLSLIAVYLLLLLGVTSRLFCYIPSFVMIACALSTASRIRCYETINKIKKE